MFRTSQGLENFYSSCLSRTKRKYRFWGCFQLLLILKLHWLVQLSQIFSMVLPMWPTELYSAFFGIAHYESEINIQKFEMSDGGRKCGKQKTIPQSVFCGIHFSDDRYSVLISDYNSHLRFIKFNTADLEKLTFLNNSIIKKCTTFQVNLMNIV